ncbi:GNAT family N-acetyltransferase [Pseudomonas sp.]|uniref:GNAT family N-acetyltransferase n=1 Tax=Pseudomonas sp. TaxID=306 RepID=UPI0028A86E8B|nr:GNAT family N-acetyltransferase [Pseudomonas sp.]
MALQLRQAEVADLPAIYRGEEHYIRTWEPAHEAAWRSELGRHLTRWVEHFNQLKIAVVDDRFAGYSLWVPDGACAELCTLHVDPALRRQGVGTALLQAYRRDAGLQGFTQLRLNVRPDNPASYLYQRAGFVWIGLTARGYRTYERSTLIP